jgi:hypothetical protein
MEAIMALPNKTGGQAGIDFIACLDNRPGGVILSVGKKIFDTKPIGSFVISSAMFRRKVMTSVHPFL